MLLEAAAVLQQVPGCQLSLVNVSVTEPDTVWVTEVWRSQAEHEVSLTLEDLKPTLLRGRPLIASVERIEMVPVGERVSGQTVNAKLDVSGRHPLLP